jgi:hypothetical protein
VDTGAVHNQKVEGAKVKKLNKRGDLDFLGTIFMVMGCLAAGLVFGIAIASQDDAVQTTNRHQISLDTPPSGRFFEDLNIYSRLFDLEGKMSGSQWQCLTWDTEIVDTIEYPRPAEGDLFPYSTLNIQSDQRSAKCNETHCVQTFYDKICTSEVLTRKPK